MLNRTAILVDSGWGDDYAYHPECAAAAGVNPGRTVDPATISPSRQGCVWCGRNVSTDEPRPADPMAQS